MFKIKINYKCKKKPNDLEKQKIRNAMQENIEYLMLNVPKNEPVPYINQDQLYYFKISKPNNKKEVNITIFEYYLNLTFIAIGDKSNKINKSTSSNDPNYKSVRQIVEERRKLMKQNK